MGRGEARGLYFDAAYKFGKGVIKIVSMYYTIPPEAKVWHPVMITMYRVLRVSDQNLISECCGEYVYLSYQILITFRYTLVLLRCT
jgi:hypothetical protein